MVRRRRPLRSRENDPFEGAALCLAFAIDRRRDAAVTPGSACAARPCEFYGDIDEQKAHREQAQWIMTGRRHSALCYGPSSKNFHGFDEFVSMASVKRITGTIALFIAEWCGTEPITAVTARVGAQERESQRPS